MMLFMGGFICGAVLTALVAYGLWIAIQRSFE